MTTAAWLSNELKHRYETAGDKERMLAIHIFGIEFASELVGHSLKDIAVAATGKESFVTEIRTGMRIAPHVQLKPRE